MHGARFNQHQLLCDHAIRSLGLLQHLVTLPGGKYMGGAAEEFCVSANTAHPQEAYLLCQFLAENHSKNAYMAKLLGVTSVPVSLVVVGVAEDVPTRRGYLDTAKVRYLR